MQCEVDVTKCAVFTFNFGIVHSHCNCDCVGAYWASARLLSTILDSDQDQSSCVCDSILCFVIFIISSNGKYNNWLDHLAHRSWWLHTNIIIQTLKTPHSVTLPEQYLSTTAHELVRRWCSRMHVELPSSAYKLHKRSEFRKPHRP